MNRTRHKKTHHFRSSGDQGFSIIESVVSAVLLVIAATAAFTLFTNTQESFRQARQKDDDQEAINEDLARIESLNRRFVCIEGSCNFIDDEDTDPDEMGYTPPYPVDTYPPGDEFNNKMREFRDVRCDTPIGRPSELIVEFKNKLIGKLSPLPSGITREIDISAASLETPPTPHAYAVIYSRTINNRELVLRRARLVPTVAGWCP